MDPLSIAASIAGLVSLTGQISSTIRDSSGAGGELKAVLDGLQEVLETIDDDTTSAKSRDRLYETLRRFEKRLEMKRTSFWSEDEVREFKQEIETRRWNLQIAVSVENGNVARSIMRRQETMQGDLLVTVKMMEIRIRRLEERWMWQEIWTYVTGLVVLNAPAPNAPALKKALKDLNDTLEPLETRLETKKALKDLKDTLERLENRLKTKRTRFWSKGEVAEFQHEIATRGGNLQIAMLVENGNMARSIVKRHDVDTMQADVLGAVRSGWKKDGAVLARENARLQVMEMRRMRRFEGRRMRKMHARNMRAAEDIWTNEMRQMAQNAARRAAPPALFFFFEFFMISPASRPER